MCPDHCCRLDYTALLADPLTHAMMASDGITEAELVALLETTRDARLASVE